MDILYLLIPLSVVLVFIIGALFWWSVRHGQFDDLEGPAYRILMDDYSPGKQEISAANARSGERAGKPVATRSGFDPDQ